MNSTTIKGHPVYTMLVPWPLGFWILAWFADLIYLSGWGGSLWQGIAFYSMWGGLLAVVMAGLPGLMDYYALDSSLLMDPQVKKIETWHFSLTLTIILIYTINLFMRTLDLAWAGGMALSTFGILLLGISGWVGGEMAYRHGRGGNLSHVFRLAGRRSA